MDFYYLTILLFLFGLIVGSFLNVVILRLPKGESLTGRSHCPQCKHTLASWDLIPVISYLILRGSCRKCKTKISSRYIVVELLTGLLFAVTPFFLGAQGSTSSSILELLLACAVISIALCVFIIDFEHYLILDIVVLTGSLIVALLLVLLDISFGTPLLQGRLLSGIYGASVGLLCLGSLWFFSNGRWMGFGDVKFMVPFGLVLGFPGVLLGIFISFIVGAVCAVPLLVFGIKSLKARVPFGTFLSVSLVLTSFFGDPILHWYLDLIGL